MIQKSNYIKSLVNLIILGKMIKLVLTNDQIGDILIMDKKHVMRGFYA